VKKKPQLLVETIPATFKILDEASSTQKGQSVKIRCEHMSVADEVNGNGRLYPFETWSREIGKLQTKLESSQLVGAADHPEDGRSRITDAAIKWTAVGMNGKTTWGEGEIIPTAKGKDLEALVRSGVTVGISSRGYGSGVQRNMNGRMVTVVSEDFSLQTFDAVLGQSVEGAHLAVADETLSFLFVHIPSVFFESKAMGLRLLTNIKPN
jgi:hypothetical protein